MNKALGIYGNSKNCKKILIKGQKRSQAPKSSCQTCSFLFLKVTTKDFLCIFARFLTAFLYQSQVFLLILLHSGLLTLLRFVLALLFKYFRPLPLKTEEKFFLNFEILNESLLNTQKSAQFLVLACI